MPRRGSARPEAHPTHTSLALGSLGSPASPPAVSLPPLVLVDPIGTPPSPLLRQGVAHQSTQGLPLTNVMGQPVGVCWQETL